MQRKIIKPLQNVTFADRSIPVIVESDFDERDGIAYITTLDSAMDDRRPKGRPVRVLQPTEDELERRLSVEAYQWAAALQGIKLLRGSEPDDLIARQGAFDLIRPLFHKDPKFKPDPKHLESYLMPAIARALKGLRPLFWRTKPNRKNKTYLVPGLYASDPKTALAALMLLAPEVHVCSHCHRIFVSRRLKQKACTVECGNAHRIARFRAKRRTA